MSARCEPREELRDVDGWHWLEIEGWAPACYRWSGSMDRWADVAMSHDGAEAYALGYRYLAPVATPAEVAALRSEVEQAHSYLDRLLQNTHPQCEPLPDLWGLCTQIDNMVTQIPKLRAEVERLREALERIANHPEANVVLTDYGPDGKQRVWPTVEQEARAALAKEPGNEG
jgi:hypothetical protein